MQLYTHHVSCHSCNRVTVSHSCYRAIQCNVSKYSAAETFFCTTAQHEHFLLITPRGADLKLIFLKLNLHNKNVFNYKFYKIILT